MGTAEANPNHVPPPQKKKEMQSFQLPSPKQTTNPSAKQARLKQSREEGGKQTRKQEIKRSRKEIVKSNTKQRKKEGRKERKKEGKKEGKNAGMGEVNTQKREKGKEGETTNTHISKQKDKCTAVGGYAAVVSTTLTVTVSRSANTSVANAAATHTPPRANSPSFRCASVPTPAVNAMLSPSSDPTESCVSNRLLLRALAESALDMVRWSTNSPALSSCRRGRAGDVGRASDSLAVMRERVEMCESIETCDFVDMCDATRPRSWIVARPGGVEASAAELVERSAQRARFAQRLGRC